MDSESMSIRELLETAADLDRRGDDNSVLYYSDAKKRGSEIGSILSEMDDRARRMAAWDHWSAAAALVGEEKATNELKFFGLEDDNEDVAEARGLFLESDFGDDDDSGDDGSTLLTIADLLRETRPESALYFYEQADENHAFGAAYIIGRMYETGEGCEQNYFMARQWYNKACFDDEDAEAALALGAMYADGRGVEQDFDGAMFCLAHIDGMRSMAIQKRMMEQADARTAMTIAEKLLMSDYWEARSSLVQPWLQCAAAKGSEDARLLLALGYDHAGAFHAMRKLRCARRGDPWAAAEMAELFAFALPGSDAERMWRERAKGRVSAVRPDPDAPKQIDAAKAYFEQKAHAGDLSAAYAMAWLHEMNNETGYAWYKECAELPQACHRLGWLKMNGGVIPVFNERTAGNPWRDLKEAAMWYDRAGSASEAHLCRGWIHLERGEGAQAADSFARAEDPDFKVLYNLGMLLLGEDGCPRDTVRAAQYLARTIEVCQERIARRARPTPWNDPEKPLAMRARAQLGRLYETGDGVAKDLDRARELYAPAAKYGVDEARAGLARLKDRE